MFVLPAPSLDMSPLKSYILANPSWEIGMIGLGEGLRRARMELGMTLEDVEAATKIRRPYLEALEAEDFSVFAAPVYGKGFLRSYAIFLGLDAEEVVRLYPESAKPVAIEPTFYSYRSSLRIAPGVVVAFVLLLAAAAGLYVYGQSQAMLATPKELVLDLPPTPTWIATRSATPQGASPAGGTVTPKGTPTKGAQTPGATPTGSGSESPTPALSPTAEASPTTPLPTPVPKMVNVPPLGGRAFAEAERLLRNAGLIVDRRDDWNQDVPAGVVYAQNPAPGQQLAASSPVVVMVSKGKRLVAVPNVYGLPEAKAQDSIAKAGLTNFRWVNYQGHDVLSDNDLSKVCVGCVLSITPGAGTEVEPGTEIKMAVRKD